MIEMRIPQKSDWYKHGANEERDVKIILNKRGVILTGRV